MATILVNARKIKGIRQNLGLTKRQLWQKTGISPATLSRIENIGKTSEPTLKKLADVFGCKPGDFLIEEIKPHNIKRKHIEEGMRMAFGKSSTACCLADLDGYITYANEGTLQLWGYEGFKEINQKHCVEFFYNKGTAWKVFELVKRQGGWVGELMAQQKDGSTTKVIATITLVLDDKNEPCCLMACFVQAIEVVKHGTIPDTGNANLSGSGGCDPIKMMGWYKD